MKKTAAELRNKAIMSLINGNLGLWPQQIVDIDLNNIRYQGGKMLLWVVRRNGAKRYVELDKGTCNTLNEYIESGRPVLLKSYDETALFLNRFGTRLATRSIQNIINDFAADQGLKINPVPPIPFKMMEGRGLSSDFIETFNWLGRGEEVIYFVKRLSDNAIKVGHSKNLPQRWGGLQQEMGELELLGIVSGSKFMEGTIKTHFSPVAKEGREIFYPTKELLQYIEVLCNKKGADDCVFNVMSSQVSETTKCYTPEIEF